MIQLATDPNARTWRPAASDGQTDASAVRRGRTGHAWPFISRQAERLSHSGQQPKRTPNSDNGS